MDTVDPKAWPELEKDDEGLLNEILQALSKAVPGDPYSSDGSFAASLAPLPAGLRAMAATHWLDISLTLDSLTWHFGNFGEPGLVEETEAGLRELGLDELAACFAEARQLMTPLLAGWTEADGDTDEILERAGLSERGDEIDRRASELSSSSPGQSIIYGAWVRYTRRHPEFVFPR